VSEWLLLNTNSAIFQLYHGENKLIFNEMMTKYALYLSKIPLPSDGFLFDLLEPWDVRALSIRKTADLPLQLWVGTFPRFVAIRFYFLSEPMGFGKSMCYVLPLFWTGSDHICKSSPMIHCGNRSFLEVT
jgi:hypothetical protein